MSDSIKTTDPFTEAAYDKAIAECGGGKADYLDTVTIFLMGANWARDHLAAQEPTDAEVEAATLELYVRSHHSTGRQTPFESLDHEDKVSWVEDGRAVLSAARAARRDEEKRDG